MGVARQFFRSACEQDLIRKNPFSAVRAGTQVNAARQFFVSRDIANRVLDACPDIESKLIFSLSRFGGLRCPSEHLLLRWSDIDWANGRITVRSPKTEHHEGKGSRVIPIFPELAVLLREASENKDRHPEYVIASRRDSSCNLRTNFCRIIRRAGLKPWPKLFHNLRSSRQTELANEFPIHVVCAWIGNSVAIARDHYLQLTDDHFRRALSGGQQIHQPHLAA